MMASYFKISFEHMKHKKLRSWLTILGIVIGIMAIISLITLGEGFENAVVGQFDQLGGNSIRVVPENLQGPPTGESGLTTDDVEVVEGVSGVDFVTPYYINFGEVEFKNEDFNQMITGFESDVMGEALEAQGIDMLDGRAFTDGESGVVIMGYSLAKDYYDSEMRVRNSVYIEGEKFKVIGITEKQGVPMADQVVYMPMEDAREMFGDGDDEETVNTIIAYISDSSDADAIAADIEKRLERSKDDDNFDVYPASQILDQLGSILQIISIVLSGIAAISLIVGGVGIMNSMYTSVVERTREIGTMKSIGAKGSEIFSLFLIEAGMVGSVGGVVGTGFGIGAAYAVQFAGQLAGMNYLDIQVRLPVILLAVGFSFTVGVISGTLPAYRASKLNPVEALRYE